MKQKFGLRIFITLAVLALSIYTIFPTWQVLSQPQDYDKPVSEQRRANFKKENPQIANKAMTLGLDLAGGTHILVEVDDSKIQDSDEKRDLIDRCLEILRNRVDQFGLSEPIIRKVGTNKIVAELAGVSAEQARNLIGATALLEFKLVVEPSEFKIVLDKIDNYVKGQNDKKGVKSDTKTEKPEENFDAIFGEIVSDSTKGKDTISETETEDIDTFKKRPFGSLLVGLPNGNVGVHLKNQQKAKNILNQPDVKKLIPRKYQFLWGKEILTFQDGTRAKQLFLVKKRPEMTGKYISDAIPGRTSTGEIDVSLEFKGKGPKEFSRITGANLQRQLAIVLDSSVYSAPVIQSKITQGRASITGLADFNEAKILSTTLRAGSLPAPMNIVELRSVGPALGKQNVTKGLQATVFGFLLIIIFMVLYYFGAGIIANIALVINLAIIGAFLSMLHATLTLPGYCGYYSYHWYGSRC